MRNRVDGARLEKRFRALKEGRVRSLPDEAVRLSRITNAPGGAPPIGGLTDLPTMKYRALACDYDGTLAHDGVVTPSTAAAVDRFRASNGIRRLRGFARARGSPGTVPRDGDGR